MKVLLVNKFHYKKGGSETYYFGLADLLMKYGHDVVFFSMKDEKNIPCNQEKYFVDNIDFNEKMSIFKIAKTSMKMLYSFEAKKKFKQLIMDEQPDIIHLNLFQSQLTGSIIDVANQFDIPIVYTTHDLKCVCPTYLMMNHGEICDKCIHGNYCHCVTNSCMKDSKAKSLLAAIEAEVYRFFHFYEKIDMIIAPSQHHKRKIEEGGVAQCPVCYIPNFLPPDTVYDFNGNKGSYFLYFGRLSIEKGVRTLIYAYAKASLSMPLLIVGTGPEENELIQLVFQLHLNENIIFLGFKSGEELNRIVSDAACVVLPSECCENAPYSIMEAQSKGKPTIVSTNGGLPELVQNGVNGFTFEPKNIDDLAHKMEEFENKSKWNNELIARSAKDMYNCEQYAKKIVDIYSKCIEEKRG